MKDIIDLTVTQIRVFAMDAIPFRGLRTQESLAQFRQHLGFAQVMLDPASPPILFQGGTFEHEGKKHVVDALAIEPRRIQMQVLASSRVADACYAAIRRLIASCDPSVKFEAEPTVTSQETTCTVTLDFEMERLFARQVISFAKEDLLPKTPLPGSKAFVRSLKLAVEVAYEMQDPRIKQQAITLSPKQFIIEPRAGTSLEERRYFTSSPLDSDEHLAVLRALEKRLA